MTITNDELKVGSVVQCHYTRMLGCGPHHWQAIGIIWDGGFIVTEYGFVMGTQTLGYILERKEKIADLPVEVMEWWKEGARNQEFRGSMLKACWGVGASYAAVDQRLRDHDAEWTSEGWKVPGSLNLDRLGLKALPKIHSVQQNFTCKYNFLENLKGSPDEVPGYFSCRNNKLSTLEGGPSKVGALIGPGKYYNCDDNCLVNLKGSPEIVHTYFSCERNQLASLEGSPRVIFGNFYCENNQLTSLEKGPEKITQSYYCGHNPLVTLKGQPNDVTTIYHDPLQKKFNSHQEPKEPLAPLDTKEPCGSQKEQQEPKSPKEPHALDVNWDSLNNTKSRGFPIGQRTKKVPIESLKEPKEKQKKPVGSCYTQKDILGQKEKTLSFLKSPSYQIEVTFDSNVPFEDRDISYSELLCTLEAMYSSLRFKIETNENQKSPIKIKYSVEREQ